MTYLLFSRPRTRAELTDVLERWRSSQFLRDIYCAFRTPTQSYGRPLPLMTKPRWFDNPDDPNQLWLPFSEWEPVKLHSIRRNTAIRYSLTFKIDMYRIYLATFNTKCATDSPDDLQALELYERVPEVESEVDIPTHRVARAIVLNRNFREFVENQMNSHLGYRSHYLRDTGDIIASDGSVAATITGVDCYERQFVYEFRVRLRLSHLESAVVVYRIARAPTFPGDEGPIHHQGYVTLTDEEMIRLLS